MLLIRQILVRTLALVPSTVALLACGQQGALYLPPAGDTHRATLPAPLTPSSESLAPNHPTTTTSSPQKP